MSKQKNQWQTKLILILMLIFIAGSFIRLYPAAVSDKPLRYDTYYHVRVAELIKQTGAIPDFDPWPAGGRPHTYPPLYHISLALTSVAFDVPIIEVSRFLLPIIASLTILAAFWFVRKFRGEKTALIATFLLAISPYLISSSYESPQVIGLLLALPLAYFMINSKYLYSGILISLIFLFNTFIAMFLSAVVLIFLLSEKRFKAMAKTFWLPAVILALFFLPKLDAFSCSNFWIGPLFISKSADAWVKFVTPAFLAMVLIPIVLIKGKTDRYRRFWYAWVGLSIVLFLSHYLTPIFHPWRQDSILMFGLVFFFAEAVSGTDKKRLFFLAVFALASLFALNSMYHSWLFDRPLTSNEYSLIDYIDTLPQNIVPLANHDMCSNLMTLTNRSCLLDTNFECIPDAKKWYDYENFFWTRDSEQMRGILSNYSISTVAFAGGDWAQSMIVSLDVNKQYSAWLPNTPDAALYEINLRQGSLSYYSERP